MHFLNIDGTLEAARLLTQHVCLAVLIFNAILTRLDKVNMQVRFYSSSAISHNQVYIVVTLVSTLYRPDVWLHGALLL